MRLLLSLSLLVVAVHCHWVDDRLAAVIKPENDDVWGTIQKIRDFSFPNLKSCEQTKACFLNLLTSTGFDSDFLPTYDDYLTKMKTSYASGQDLKNYCGTFDAVSQCFSQESDSCRTPTVFESLFNISHDEAYRFVSDLDLRKIMCDNQQAVNDPCMKTMTAVQSSFPVENDADATCDVVAAEFSEFISRSEAAACPDSVASVSCQINSKTKEIETLGACDGKIPKCPTNFHSCDRMQSCFEEFYGSIEKITMKSSLPDYDAYAKTMKNKFENANGIDQMCPLQTSLHACLLRHVNKNCPLNAASFRSMFNLNYEQAYSYSTDFNLRKEQCLNKEGVKENSCVGKAHLMNLCEPHIPHNLTLGQSCTDLRLAMKCENFAVRQACKPEARKMFCITQEIIYQQKALGFCDGWMPDCDDWETTDAPVETTEEAPKSTTIESVSDILKKLQNLTNLSLPNFAGCEQTRVCFLDLLTSTGFDSNSFPSYAEYSTKMKANFASGQALKNYCGTFAAVSQCFSQELDSCRTETVFATLFDISPDEAYQFASDLDLRKIMCDNQQAVNDPCMKKMTAVQSIIPVRDGAAVSCDVSSVADAGCSDSVASVSCQINSKTKQIETLRACDGIIPKCNTNFHSCDRMQSCFDQFYGLVEQAGVKSPLPNYADYAKNMKSKFENANGIDCMCRLQSGLHACLLRHVNKNCPINAASFRSMYNMNYEQAYSYSSDFNLRKEQCLNKEGVKKNNCLTIAKPLLNMCQPHIPHNLTLGESCTDLRLAAKCNNFAVRQSCSDETLKMYCSTQNIIYEQGSLGFCDGWMPDCDNLPYPTAPATAAPPKTPESPITCPAWTMPTTTTTTTKAPLSTTTPTAQPPLSTGTTDRRTPPTTTSTTPDPTRTTRSSEGSSTVTSPAPTTPTTSLSSLPVSIVSALLVILRLTL